jgi:nucleotide-binding universal stress UspA family protein
MLEHTTYLEAIQNFLKSEKYQQNHPFVVLRDRKTGPSADEAYPLLRSPPATLALDTTAVTHCPFRRILVAVDSSDQARWALDVGASLARKLRAELALLHVDDTPTLWTSGLSAGVLGGLELHGSQLLHGLAKHVPASIHPLEILRQGEPDREIIAGARDWAADLIIIGTHGRGSVSRFFRLLGSVAEYVVRYAPCPVITVSHDPATAHVAARGQTEPLEEEVVEDALAGTAY